MTMIAGPIGWGVKNPCLPKPEMRRVDLERRSYHVEMYWPDLFRFKKVWPVFWEIPVVLKALFFARCADWMEKREMDISLDSPVRLVDLIEITPELAPVRERLKSLKVAVNREIVDIDTEVHDGDEVAFLPPLGGG